MKQHITVDDLNELSDSQRRALNELWLPTPFTWAVAYICRDVEIERYEPHAFVIGGISLNGTRVYLTDLRALLSGAAHDSIPAEEEEETRKESSGGFLQRFFGNVEEEEDEGPDEGEPLPEGWDSMGFDAFPKEDCLPLFTLGQLMECLQKLGYGEGAFHVGVRPTEEESWVDRDVPGSYGAEYESEELCDALWAAVKAMLN